MIEKYEAGASLPTLAREYGGSHVTVRNAMRRAGGATRPFKHLPWRSFTPEQLEDVIARWHAGEAQTRIAKDFGTDQTVISRLLIANGIEPGPRKRNQRGENNSRWAGGRTSNASGYHAVRVDPADPLAVMRMQNGYVMEHRLVMARHLGRPLVSDESVHHVNGDRQDNRLENLELWVRSQPNGQRATDLLAWAKGLVARYESEERLLLFR